MINNLFSKVLANLQLTDTGIKYNGILCIPLLPEILNKLTRISFFSGPFHNFEHLKINWGLWVFENQPTLHSGRSYVHLCPIMSIYVSFYPLPVVSVRFCPLIFFISVNFCPILFVYFFCPFGDLFGIKISVSSIQI